MGVFGIVEMLFPRRVVEFGTRISYEHPEEFEVKPWVVTAARIERLFFVLLALSEHLRERGSRPGQSTETSE